MAHWALIKRDSRSMMKKIMKPYAIWRPVCITYLHGRNFSGDICHLVRQLHVPLMKHHHLEQQYSHTETEGHKRKPLEPSWVLFIFHYLRLEIFLDKLRKSAECSMCHGYNTVSANKNDRTETVNTNTGTHFVQRGGSSFIC
jgi:hypothetical protein